MKFKTALGTVLLSTALTASAAMATANDFVKPAHNTLQATEYGKTLPPIGYVKFCATTQDECKFAGGKNNRLHLTTENWDQISQVNRYANTKIRPVTDLALHGVADTWSYPVDAGDCEDYVLLKKKYLVGMGFKAEHLPITVVLDENNEGHAILTVITDKGDFILDNRRAEILRWDETGYTFLKRQSQQQATSWVSLQKQPPQVLVGTRSN